MLPSETMIWQPEFTDKTLSRKPGAVQYGVGPVCSELHIAPSTYYHCQQQRHHPDKRSARAQHDDWLKREIQRVYDENHQVYGVRKVWRQLLREGIRVARCTVARLMAVMGLAGVLRGKKVRTTISRKAVAAGDRVNRQFVAERPDQLWVADFTYVSTWQGFVYVAFIIDVFAGYIVGWRVSSSMETTFVLDALEQRCGPVVRLAPSITAIKALSMCHWPIRSD
ncbi:transposase [Escherichia coli]|nr:transposase [Escherichia coli]